MIEEILDEELRRLSLDKAVGFELAIHPNGRKMKIPQGIGKVSLNRMNVPRLSRHLGTIPGDGTYRSV